MNLAAANYCDPDGPCSPEHRLTNNEIVDFCFVPDPVSTRDAHRLTNNEIVDFCGPSMLHWVGICRLDEAEPAHSPTPGPLLSPGILHPATKHR